MQAYIHYFLGENPDNMDEDEIVQRWSRVRYVLEETGQMKFE